MKRNNNGTDGLCIKQAGIHRSYFISLIVFVPMLIITGITGGFPGGMGFRKATLPIVIMPILYPIMGFLMPALWCWLYDGIAQRIGGIEFEDEVIEQ